jgi:hypothetical protein
MKQLTPKTRRRTVALILAMVAVTVISAFSIVWMQQQISRTAERSQKLESQLAETLRKLRFLDERIASYHQPAVLQGKVAGVLRPSMENQVVWVEERQLPSGRSYAVSQPYEVSSDLALLDTSSAR